MVAKITHSPHRTPPQTNADKGTRFGLIGCQDNSLPSSNSSSATSASVDGFDELAKYAAHGGHTVLILDLNVKNSDKTLIKDLVWKITRGIDVLQALPEVQAEHLGLFADEACAVAGLLAVAMDQRLITNYIAIPQPTDTRSQLVDLGCSWSELLSTVAPRKLNVWQADALLSVEDSNDIFRPVREIYGLRKATDAFHIVEQRTASLKAWIDSP